MGNQKTNSVVDKILDEENCDNIILYDEDNNEIEFQQIAVIPFEDKTYVILHPVEKLEGLEDDEALVYYIDEENDEVLIVDDENIILAVFDEYYKLLREEDK